ncbi:MAG TPA: hypothetical protein VGQ87_01970 [Patescibacteria group bacterium]|jgi:hypothetical protein|nr:hypothetical protein [Patescibacteria group bacterium]
MYKKPLFIVAVLLGTLAIASLLFGITKKSELNKPKPEWIFEADNKTYSTKVSLRFDNYTTATGTKVPTQTFILGSFDLGCEVIEPPASEMQKQGAVGFAACGPGEVKRQFAVYEEPVLIFRVNSRLFTPRDPNPRDFTPWSAIDLVNNYQEVYEKGP